MTSLERAEQSRVRDLINAGAEVTGSAAASVAGVGIGYTLGGPTGAAAGATFGAVAGPTARIMLQDMAHGALDFTYRMLGQREKVRVGAVVVYSYEKFQANINDGQQLRQDGFFDDAFGERSADKEIFEGILIAAQREHQEKKLRFLGNLVANIAFHSEYDKDHANHLIKIAEELTYQQLCILSLAGSEDQLRLAPGQEDYQSKRLTRVEQVGLITEIYDLCQRQMLATPEGDTLEFAIREVVPFTLSIDNTGASLYTLMELGSMDDQDLAPLIRLLQ